MNKKKRNFYIIIIVITIILINLLYFGLKKIYRVENNSNVIQEEQNIEEDIIENIIENDEDSKQYEVTETNIEEKDSNIEQIDNKESQVNNTNNTKQTEIKESQINKDNIKQETKKVTIQNTSVTSTYDENAFIDNHLKKYPYYEDKYATLKISKISVNAPIYFGANDNTIAKGIGHNSGSYFPGENGAIIMCRTQLYAQF